MRGDLPVEGSGEKKPKPDLIVIMSDVQDYTWTTIYRASLKGEGKVLFQAGQESTAEKALSSIRTIAKNLYPEMTEDEINQLPVVKKF